MQDQHPELFDDISRCGYYPEVISRALDDALGTEPVRAFVLQHEPTFDGDQLRRHMTVLTLTPTRVLVLHTDEHPGEPPAVAPYTSTAVEAVSIATVKSVVVSRVVDSDTATLQEALLSISWGSTARVDLEPARCPDPECEANHGYTGSMTAEDFTISFTAVGDGEAGLERMLEFARMLSAATASGVSAGHL